MILRSRNQKMSGPYSRVTFQTQLDAFYVSQGCDQHGRKLLPTTIPTTMPATVISEEKPEKPGFFDKLVRGGKGFKKPDPPSPPSPSSSVTGFASGGRSSGYGGGAAVAGSKIPPSKPEISRPSPDEKFTGLASGGGAAHSSHGHSTHSRRLTKVDKMGVVRHVFCMIQLSCGYFLLVQGTDSNWGPPGGNVEKGEISWKAAKREFEEETGSILPTLNGQPLGSTTHEPLKFHWAHLSSTSGFYCGSTTSSYHDFSRNFRKSKEIIGIGGFTVKELWQMVNVTHADFTLRPCAIESTRALLIELGFPERS